MKLMEEQLLAALPKQALFYCYLFSTVWTIQNSLVGLCNAFKNKEHISTEKHYRQARQWNKDCNHITNGHARYECENKSQCFFFGIPVFYYSHMAGISAFTACIVTYTLKLL